MITQASVFPTETKSEIESKNYQGKGIVKFQRKERDWWICLSDIVALYPPTDKEFYEEPFSLENWLRISIKKWFNLSFEEWLNLEPKTIARLNLFLERKEAEIWGTGEIAIELSRVPQTDDFKDFPLWIATLGRSPIE